MVSTLGYILSITLNGISANSKGNKMQIIDLRSDTVTHPTAAMRTAMASAEVGDDVYGDDPTVNRLERLGAEMLGKEAAVFTPSGTFGNELALFTWCPRGSEVVLGEECHIIQHEAGGAAFIAGVQTRAIPAPDGVLTRAALQARLRRADLHAPGSSLICLENAHSSGQVVSLADMDAIRSLADEWKLPIHLDGARIFNAATALGVSARDIAARADSVMFCLSKGLCAPIGSLLAGSKDFVAAARLKRKVMGGGMRQAGILAAAGIIALTDMTERVGEDHAHAKSLARFLSTLPDVCIDVDTVQINMVFFSYPPARSPIVGARIMSAFAQEGVRISPPDDGVFRFVIHYWIGDRELETVKKTAEKVLTGR
jgi:threonine aldolase